jgi:ABC-type phosphate transport system substrate-binding protein
MRLRLFVFCLLLAACAKREENLPPEETATTGAFELVADEGIKPAVDSLVRGFNAQYTSAKVTVRYLPATLALDELLQHKARLVIIGRPLASRERASLGSQKVELPEFEIALNGIGCLVSQNDKRDSISLADLASGISGKDLFVKALTSNLSSTEAILDSLFLSDTGSVRGKAYRYQTTDSVLTRVRAGDGVLGFASVSWIKGDTSVKALKVGVKYSAGIAKFYLLHPAYIYQKLYPLVSRVVGYTFEPPNTLPRGFLAYAMSAPGQRIFLDYDLIPRTQIIKLVPPKE